MRSWYLILILFASVALSPSSRSHAAKPATNQDDMVVLFDGTTLDGWHKNPEPIGHGTGGRWTVEDGTITGEQDPPGSGNGGILLTDRKFGNFELHLDIKPDWGICSGLFVRSNDQGQCLQMMVDYHDAGNVGHIYGEGTGGFNNRPFEIFGKYQGETLESLEARPTEAKLPAAYSVSGKDWVEAWKLGDWNAVKVRVRGNPAHVTTWINDVKISDFDGTTFDGEAYDREGVAKTLGSEGSIAVQVHGGKSWPDGAKCRWKNIRVKLLP